MKNPFLHTLWVCAALTSLVSAQNLVNMLTMMQNPSPAMQRKLESGEIDPGQVIQQVAESINRALDVIDFYRETLDGR